MKRGKKRYAVISLLIGFAMLGGAMSCQKDDSASPTSSAVNIPTFPKAEQRVDRESFAAENFYADENSACQFSARPEKEYFLVSVPAGDYRITYTTWIGTFYIAARAEKCATLRIGLNPCDEVKSVSIQRGSITGIGCSTWPSGPVTLYSWPCGGTAECSQVFTSDGSTSISLLDGAGSASNPMPTCGRSPIPCQGNTCGGQPGDDPGARGDISFTLTWSYTNSNAEGPDIDMWIVEPNGSALSTSRDGYSLGPTPSGGEIDFDDQGATGPGDGGGPERAYWPTGHAPTGRYTYGVRYYNGIGTAYYTFKVYKNTTLVQTHTGTLTCSGYGGQVPLCSRVELGTITLP